MMGPKAAPICDSLAPSAPECCHLPLPRDALEGEWPQGVPEVIRQVAGGGCQSSYGRFLSVANGVGAGCSEGENISNAALTFPSLRNRSELVPPLST